MQHALVDFNTGATTKNNVELSPATFGREFNEALVHQVIVSCEANSRGSNNDGNSTKGVKNRSAVSGGGAKPWRQKGTGRARAGTSRGPIWRKGGVTFDLRTKFSQKINKKMFKGAMKSILSGLVVHDRLHLVESIDIDQPKTKVLKDKLNSLNLNSVMIVDVKPSDNLYLSARNIPRATVRDVERLDPVSLIKYDNVIMTVAAVKHLEEVLS